MPVVILFSSSALAPGERGARSERDRRQPGIPLGPKVWRELAGLADALGVPVPAPGSGAARLRLPLVTSAG
jgi:hypothetical protein